MLNTVCVGVEYKRVFEQVSSTPHHLTTFVPNIYTQYTYMYWATPPYVLGACTQYMLLFNTYIFKKCHPIHMCSVAQYIYSVTQDACNARTTNLPERIINDLRLHLSWDMGLRTFSWSREAIGTRIIYRFKELGTFLFMKHVIINENNSKNK